VHADGSADRDHVEVRALDERLPVGGEVLDAEPPAGLLDRGLPATAERDDLELLDGYSSAASRVARAPPAASAAAIVRSTRSATAAPPADVLYGRSESGVRRAYGVDLPPEAEEYRAAARAFVETYRATPEADRRRVIAESGYLVQHWPPPFGRGASPVEQLVIEEELAAVETPDLGVTGWVLLTLTQTATQEQIDRWVPTTLAGGVTWCQLFSEPGAGSDAAAVQTRGVKVEGGRLVTGRKVWTSGAHLSSFGLATIRTDPTAAKRRGITAVVVDMHTTGVEVRPLRQITGGAEFDEVFFDDVFVPDSDVSSSRDVPAGTSGQGFGLDHVSRRNVAPPL
jgi:hypothetical protein